MYRTMNKLTVEFNEYDNLQLTMAGNRMDEMVAEIAVIAYALHKPTLVSRWYDSDGTTWIFGD